MEISSLSGSYSGFSMQGMQGMRKPPSEEEMAARDAEMSQRIFTDKDADQSGTLTADELGIDSEKLASLDSDGDGVLDEEELTAGLKAKREAFKAKMDQQMAQNSLMGQMQAQMSQVGDEDSDEESALDSLTALMRRKANDAYQAQQQPSTDDVISRLFSDDSEELAGAVEKFQSNFSSLNLSSSLLQSLFANSDSSQGLSLTA